MVQRFGASPACLAMHQAGLAQWSKFTTFQKQTAAPMPFSDSLAFRRRAEAMKSYCGRICCSNLSFCLGQKDRNHRSSTSTTEHLIRKRPPKQIKRPSMLTQAMVPCPNDQALGGAHYFSTDPTSHSNLAAVLKGR